MQPNPPLGFSAVGLKVCVEGTWVSVLSPTLYLHLGICISTTRPGDGSRCPDATSNGKNAGLYAAILSIRPMEDNLVKCTICVGCATAILGRNRRR